METIGLENGVTVELPPGRGEILPIDAAASQNLTITSSPEVHICVGNSVEDVGDAYRPKSESRQTLLLEENDDE